jgi:hypothetical protein
MKTSFTLVNLCLVLSSSVSVAQDIQRTDASRSTRPFVAAIPTQTNVNKMWGIDIYGAIPKPSPGGGGGFGFFSPALNASTGTAIASGIQVRLGFDFYIVGTGHKTFYNIPLSASQSGDAKVRLQQNNLGLNIAARFSGSYSNKLIPYVDVFGGWRSFNATMDIEPNVKQPGYESSTSSNLTSVNHWAYGGTIGIMYSINPYVKFNTGLMYTTSASKGQITDVLHATNENNNIVTSNITTSKDMFIVKVGFTFLLDPDNRSNNKDCNCNCNKSTRTYGYYGGGYHGGGGASNHISIGGGRPSK